MSAMARNSHAAFLTAYYWPEVRRGTERLVHDLATGLADRGRSTVIMAGHPGGPTRRSHEDGVEIARLRTLPERLPRRFGYTDRVGHLPALIRALRADKPAVAHSFGMFEAASARLALDRRTTKVLTVPGIPQREVIEGLRWRRRALRSAVESSGAIVLICAAAQEASRWLGGEQRLIYPGIDLVAFQRTAERAEQPTLLCAAAPEDPRKRVGLVIDTFRSLRRGLPDARLILSQRGAAAKAAEPGIEYRDLDSHDAMVRAYSESWATVLASTSEAFGLVAVESLACGTPVVATSDAGIVEAVGADGSQSRLIELDGSDLTAGMREILDRTGDPTVERACREQAGKFSLERCLDEHEALYAELKAAAS
jgi:glycosyltransferase involved in cell wall biosynthesis